ncbi:unnamed protein product [Arabis nemorensis]|uniref:Uncharacterized protein n=1 Tax=Arabis nemorensis TaxID=586526 RepID=A0A565BZ81_9BRAS|nr:unnamed protein product [Arabis nemorensis]
MVSSDVGDRVNLGVRKCSNLRGDSKEDDFSRRKNLTIGKTMHVVGAVATTPQKVRDCVRVCREELPGIVLSMAKSNDWKDYACSGCYRASTPQKVRDCVRVCREKLPWLTLS